MTYVQTYLLLMLHTARDGDLAMALVLWASPVMALAGAAALAADALTTLFGRE